MGDYHDIYVKTDVLLLFDVFENSINICLQYCTLDPCHYFSSPGLSWDTIFKMTGIELELVSDTDMYLFVKEGMRVGIYFIKANNKYM